MRGDHGKGTKGRDSDAISDVDISRHTEMSEIDVWRSLNPTYFGSVLFRADDDGDDDGEDDDGKEWKIMKSECVLRFESPLVDKYYYKERRNGDV